MDVAGGAGGVAGGSRPGTREEAEISLGDLSASFHPYDHRFVFQKCAGGAAPTALHTRGTEAHLPPRIGAYWPGGCLEQVLCYILHCHVLV